MQSNIEARGDPAARTNVNLNLALIAACEFLFTATLAISNTLLGVVSKTLTRNVHLVTAPYAAMTLSAALTTIGASALMHRVGRPRGFIVGAFAATLGGVIAVLALWLHDFWTFCAAFGLIGVYKAFAQYYRFAAAEVVPASSPAHRSNAVAVVLVGSFVAAISGPWIAARVRNLVPALPYGGSFLAIVLMGAATLAFVASLRFPASTSRTSVADSHHRMKLSALLQRRDIFVAIVSATIGYTVMAVMMVTAPLAATGYGASVSTAALIMQFHVAGMYAPSLISGRIINKYGTRSTIFVGCLLQLLATSIAFSSASVPAFVAALLLCGVGWNLMYVSSTVLLTNSCSQDERAAVQGTSEFIMFSFVTVASFGAATALNRYGWHGLQLLLAVPLLISAVVAVSVRTNNTLQTGSYP